MDDVVVGLREVQRAVLAELAERRVEVDRLELLLADQRAAIEDHRFDLGMLEQQLRGRR